MQPMKLKTTLQNAPRQAIRALLRTPLEVILGAVAGIGVALAIEDVVTRKIATRLGIIAAIALPPLFTTSLLAAAGAISRPVRWLAAAVLITAAALYGSLGFDPDLTAEGWRAATLITTSVLVLLATPILAHDPAATPSLRADLYHFDARLTLRVVIVGLYALALYAGLAAALAAVNGLFSLELPGRIYAHLAALVFILLPPWAIAAGLPALIAPTTPWGETTLRVLRRTALLLLVPLIGAYLLIVYAYLVRMIVTGEVPSNLISPVVLGAGAIMIAAIVVVEPLHGREDSMGLTRFVRILPAALLPLTALALWAVLIRVGQYGWTEFRYLRTIVVLLLGAYTIAASWRLLRRRLPPLTALPAIAAPVLLIAAIGPLSAPAVSLHSQETRLAALLAKARALPAMAPDSMTTPIAPTAPPPLSTPVNVELLDDITSGARYLRNHFGAEVLRPFLAPGAELPADYATPTLASASGLAEVYDDAPPRITHATLPDGAEITGVDGGKIYIVDYQRLMNPASPSTPGTPQSPSPSSPQIPAWPQATLGRNGTELTFRPPGRTPLIV